jgi:HSP20 family protein
MAVPRVRRDGVTEPISEMERLQDEINKLFDFDTDIFGSGLFDRSVSPALDVAERSEEFVVTCELPGVDQKDLNISLSNNILTIKGRKHPPFDEHKVRLYRNEIWSGDFQRTLSLPTSVDPDKISASLKDGILTLSVPKREELKPKQITVNVK